MSDKEPEWNSGDPQGWSTSWEAWYKISNADPVRVDGFCRSESIAVNIAEDGLATALKVVVKLGLQVEAKSWTVKHRSRTQHQYFPEANIKEYATRKWGGVLQQVLKSLTEKGQP